jgi:predicted RNase H-like nuclease
MLDETPQTQVKYALEWSKTISKVERKCTGNDRPTVMGNVVGKRNVEKGSGMRKPVKV